MTHRYGIDTSVLMRLLTGDPEAEYIRCERHLRSLIAEGAEILASNQVIGEAYVAVRHHYGVSREEARDGLIRVLQSGVVAPSNGRKVLGALGVSGGAGLPDRLIATTTPAPGSKS